MTNLTKNAIKKSLLELLNERPINKISVKDIVERCQINRNSFYYHYQDIPAVIEEIVKEEADNIVSKCHTINSLSMAIDIAFSFAKENKKAVYHLYNSANRDIFIRFTMELSEYVVKIYLTNTFGEEKSKDRDVFLNILKASLFGCVIDWIISGMDDNAINDIHRLITLCSGFSEEIAKRSKEI